MCVLPAKVCASTGFATVCWTNPRTAAAADMWNWWERERLSQPKITDFLPRLGDSAQQQAAGGRALGGLLLAPACRSAVVPRARWHPSF